MAVFSDRLCRQITKHVAKHSRRRPTAGEIEAARETVRAAGWHMVDADTAARLADVDNDGIFAELLASGDLIACASPRGVWWICGPHEVEQVIADTAAAECA